MFILLTDLYVCITLIVDFYIQPKLLFKVMKKNILKKLMGFRNIVHIAMLTNICTFYVNKWLKHDYNVQFLIH